MEDNLDHLEQVFFELLALDKKERKERLNEMETSEAMALVEMLEHHSEAGKDGFLEVDHTATPPSTIPKSFGSYWDLLRLCY